MDCVRTSLFFITGGPCKDTENNHISELVLVYKVIRLGRKRNKNSVEMLSIRTIYAIYLN